MRIAALLIAAALAASASADEIHLKNGSILYGTVVEEDAEGVWVEVAGGGRVRIPHDELAAIERDAEAELREVSELVRVGAWPTAVATLQARLAERPDPALRGLLVRAYRGWIEQQLALDAPYRAAELVRDARAALGDDALADLGASVEARLDALDERLAEALRRHHAGDFAAARDGFAAVAAAAPLLLEEFASEYARCEAALGDAALEEGRWRAAVEHFRAGLELDPGLGVGLQERLVYAGGLELSALLEAGELERARDRVDRLRREFPSSGIGAFFDAQLKVAEGSYERAAELYRSLFLPDNPLSRSADLAALEPAAEELVSELLGREVGSRERRWSQTTSARSLTYRTEHFLIRHRNELVVGEVAAALEAAREEVAGRFDLEPLDGRIEVVLHPDTDSFRRAGACEGYGGLGTVACRGSKVRARRIDLLQSAPRLLTSAIPHEVAHVLWRNAALGADTPLWLREGVATQFEPATTRAAFVSLYRRRVRGRMSLLELIGWRHYPRSADDAEERVAFAHVTVALLMEEGSPEDLLMLGRMLVNDLPLQFALGRLYGFAELEDLERAVVRRFGKAP